MFDTMVETKVIEDAVRLACRAPSLYNTQPWRWVADGAGLDLLLDTSRVVHADRSMREAHISCGGALEHLRAAMAAAGWTAEVERFPEPGNPRHLARVSFAPSDGVTDHQRRRADAILQRRTDRLPVPRAARLGILRGLAPRQDRRGRGALGRTVGGDASAPGRSGRVHRVAAPV